MFKIILFSLSFLPLLLQAKPVIDVSNPYTMLAQVSELTFSRINSEKILIKENKKHLETIVEQEMLPYVDYKYAAYKVIGQHLSKTTKQQRTRFVAAFKVYLLATYAQALTNYDDQVVKVEPSKKIKNNEKFVTVKVLITSPDNKNIQLQFQTRKLKNGVEWRVYDMTAEGVSLLSTKKSELGGLIRTQGIDAVSVLLENKAKTLENEFPSKVK